MKICNRLAIVAATALLIPSLALALGGKVTYPNGQSAAGAVVRVTLDGKEGGSVLVGSDGRFVFDKAGLEKAMIQISVPDGKSYATVTLPALIFTGNGAAVVLQPKK
jgi:hypothetical protein